MNIYYGQLIVIKTLKRLDTVMFSMEIVKETHLVPASYENMLRY